MLVSIIMPAFNAERYIDEALRSVRGQTHNNIEIIVVNDASTDGTLQRVENHCSEDPRITLIRLPYNQGQSAAINHGVARAKGDYIKFFDADDILSPESVSTQLSSIRGRPRHLAYGTWGRFIQLPAEAEFTHRSEWHDSDSPLDWIIETWTNQEPMYQCALFLIPRPLLEEIGGWNPRLGLINDFEFFTRLVLASDGIRFTPNLKLYYRSNLPSSLSNQKSRSACESACLSKLLGVRHLLAIEDSPRTRRLAADLLQDHIYAFYPQFPDLLEPINIEINRLGGSFLRPKGGAGFRSVCILLGWRTALRIRRLRSKKTQRSITPKKVVL